MNCTFLSTVYSTILIIEAIYFRKMICTTWRVRRWWCRWAGFLLHFYFQWKPSLLVTGNLMHQPPGSPLNYRTMEMVHHNLSQDGEWLNLALVLENTWQNQSLWDFLTGCAYMWLLEPTSLAVFFSMFSHLWKEDWSCGSLVNTP